MKRSVLVLLIIAMVLSVLAVAGCESAPVPGKSAYEIACENGFVGSEREWLASLKGSDGKDAPALDIYDLYDAFKAENADATFEDFLATLSIADYHDTEYAVAKGIQSAVSIFSTFTKGGLIGATEYGGAGAGVIYKISEGDVYIITNYHVIYDRDSNTEGGIASKIEAYTYGLEVRGRGVPAEFIGGSITKDIAVLKAALGDFSTQVVAVELADSNELLLGERAIAIGNPSAEGMSVSVGVVSVDSEQIEMDSLDSSTSSIVMRVIRTDTPINKGNSGGGLFNRRGQLIGIVNAKTIESGVENIGYAIPVNVAKGIADCVMENGARKVILGVMATALATETRFSSEKNRVEIIEEVTVDSVTEGMLADGKLEAEDILEAVRINEGEYFELTRLFQLSDYLYKVREGDIITLRITRNSNTMTITLTPTPPNFQPV